MIKVPFSIILKINEVILPSDTAIGNNALSFGLSLDVIKPCILQERLFLNGIAIVVCKEDQNSKMGLT